MNNSLKFSYHSILESRFNHSTSRLNKSSSSIIESLHHNKILNTNQIIHRNELKPKIAIFEKNTSKHSSQNHLHLLVHGSTGGKIHTSLYSLVEELRKRMKRSVSIEALTDPNPKNINAGNRPVLFVPLFLLPGNHVLLDVPTIFKRYTKEGLNIKLFPFLGSSLSWLSLLGDFVNKQNTLVKPALIHHPVNTPSSKEFLRNIERFLKIPLISGARWNQDSSDMLKKFFPIPYILTPNKNVQIKFNGFQRNSLLENENIRYEIVDFLGKLP